MKNFLFLFFFSLIIFASCNKDADDTQLIPDVTSMDDMVVSPNFSFKTTQNVSVELLAQDNAGIPLKFIRFNVYTDALENGGVLIASGATDNNGSLKLQIPFPSYYDSVVVSTDYIGLVNQVKIPITGGKASYLFGGIPSKNKSSLVFLTPKSTNASIKFLGSYTNNGIPQYLALPNSTIDGNLLNDINAWLPERKPVPTNNSQYLATSNETNVVLSQAAEVWVTFVHEGAGYMNVLGFYTYNTSSPITNVNQIDSITIVFPNASLSGSGGGLFSGNRVKIGTFPANTGIGWVLFANGWGGSVNANAPKYYSDPELNPEALAANKQHTVLLHDVGRGLFLCGFEDINRTPGNSSDNDFNDLIFYVKSNPIQAISQNNVIQATNTLTDTDNDGISDLFDDYPTDQLRAFNNYFPSKTQFGTLAFEDLWPSKGDFDFNDVIVDYRFNPITNAANEVVNIQSKFVVRATGAGYSNGFGFQIPILPFGAVQSVTGTNLTEQGFISTLASGVEANQSKATVIVFDNAWKNFSNINGSNANGLSGINTSIGGKSGVPDTLNVNLTFVQPINSSVIGLPPYNPFIIANKQRGKEIHLSDYPPTDLVDANLFGTINDNSNPLTGRYYKTINNLPWGINITERYNYTIEKAEIIQGHLKFVSWAQSSGVYFKDWYKSSTGYRNSVFIYPN
jgi:LruC domain-containing protein